MRHSPSAKDVAFDAVLWIVFALLFATSIVAMAPLALGALALLMPCHVFILWHRYVRQSRVQWPMAFEWVALGCALCFTISAFWPWPTTAWRGVAMATTGLVMGWGHLRKLRYGDSVDYYVEFR